MIEQGNFADILEKSALARGAVLQIEQRLSLDPTSVSGSDAIDSYLHVARLNATLLMEGLMRIEAWRAEKRPATEAEILRVFGGGRGL